MVNIRERFMTTFRCGKIFNSKVGKIFSDWIEDDKNEMRTKTKELLEAIDSEK